MEQASNLIIAQSLPGASLTEGEGTTKVAGKVSN
jgi:hypothetical protein